MLNRSNLIPTPTVDKNGKQTTVYRKAGSSSPAASIPAPEIKGAYNEELVRETAQEMLKGLFAGTASAGEASKRRAVVSELRKYPEELVRSIHDVIMVERNPIDSENLRESLAELMAEKPSEIEVREALLFFPVLSRWNENVSRGIIDSLREYEQIPESSDYSRESDDVKAKCLALVTVAGEVFRFPSNDNFKKVGESHLVLADDDLVELTLEFPDRVDRIVDVINERESLDPVLLRSVIASDSMALGDGSL